MLPEWEDYEHDGFNNKKYTTMAKVGNRLYAPPYSENPNFDVLTKFVDGKWITERTGIKETSRTYFAHSVASNGKIFCPPAGHEETWSEMLVILANGEHYTKDLGIGKESKKYFAGLENSQRKIYYIPRGGCVCEPVDTWKSQGDLAEVLVIDTETNETSQQIQSVDTTASIVTETFQSEEKILPQDLNAEEQYEFATSFLKVGDYSTAERAFRELLYQP